ncbi:MAG TPA: glutathione S-transferase family protein [Solirubrobacteraceae bacterium]
MTATLYGVPGSHPAATVARALELKGIPFKRVDLLPVTHWALQRLRFGSRTVPGVVLDGGEKVTGSMAILQRLDELVPSPPLHPADPTARADVERAERWGDEVLQPLARRVTWVALRRAPKAMTSFAEGAKLPIPVSVAGLSAAPVAFVESRVNRASDENVRADLANLGHHLDRVDAWIAEGVMAGDAPNAADLQIGASLRLMLNVADVAPLIDARPAGRLARAQFPVFPGHVPAGTLPSGWLPAAAPPPAG